LGKCFASGEAWKGERFGCRLSERGLHRPNRAGILRGKLRDMGDTVVGVPVRPAPKSEAK